jgi:drug/metabolite transporter (DMT)-like permease
MANTLLLIFSMVAGLGVNVLKKYYTGHSTTAVSGGFRYNAVVGLISGIVLLCWGSFGTVSRYTLLLGILFGAITALQNVTSTVAFQCGPMSYTTVIICFSTLIPALSGAVFFDETIGWAQLVGIVLMLGSFLLAVERNAEEKSATLKWLALCLVALLGNGGIGIMQKVHQSSVYRDELTPFLVLAFATSSLLCTVFTFLFRRREGRPDASGRTTKKSLLLLVVMLFSGICVAVINKLNLYLSGVMDSAIFFPVVNGGGLVLTTLAALILFRERLSKKQWIGLLLGIASVIFLCNPFA